MKNDTTDRFDLRGAIALITGGAGFLGEKHAEAILDGNGKTVLVDINRERLDDVVARLRNVYGERVWGVSLDITDETHVRETVSSIKKDIGNISILINNAANNPQVTTGTDRSKFTRLEHFSREMWDQDIAVGLTGAFLMSKYVAPDMAQRGKGVILNIASELGLIAPDQRLYRKEGLEEDGQPVKPVTYSVVKHGIIGLSKYLSTYWIGKGIRSNAVAFGGVANDTPPEFLERIGKLSPIGMMADRDEYKAVVLFLCSDASSYMTGATISIDGGRTVW